MSMKKNIIISSVIVVLVAAILAVSFSGDKGVDLKGKTPEEVKAYFKSNEFQSLDMKDKIAVKKKIYAPEYRRREQEFIEQCKTYSQLKGRQKVVYLDKLIDEYVDGAAKKRAAVEKKTAGGKGDYAKKTDGKGGKGFTAENYRGWSEKVDPVKRAYILELKDAMQERMDERGIEFGK